MTERASKKYRSVLIFGPPGCGKGTLGKFLSGAGNHFHLSSGDIFRGISLESPAGKLYHSYASKGKLLPDTVTIEIWHKYVEGLIATNRYFPSKQLLLLDGIPRTKKQAQLIKPYVKIEHIILLETPNEKELMQRIRRRALIEKRADDKDPEVLKTRMDIYHKETKEVLGFYSKKIISKFNADQKPIKVLTDVLKQISEVLTL